MLGCRISRSKHDHAAPWGSGKGTEHAGDGREEHAILRRSVEGACDRNRPALRLARGPAGPSGLKTRAETSGGSPEGLPFGAGLGRREAQRVQAGTLAAGGRGRLWLDCRLQIGDFRFQKERALRASRLRRASARPCQSASVRNTAASVAR